MTTHFDPTRRIVLQFGALGITAPWWSRAAGREVAPPLAQLSYAQVTLAPGPLATQATQNHQLLLGMDENALLRPFRVREGLPAPGEEMGGWYGTHAFAPGANFGQWVSGMARYAAITGDASTREKVARLVDGYGATVGPQGRFYRDNRFPSYTYDKLVGALADTHRLTGHASSLAILKRTNRAAMPYLPAHAVPRNEHALPGEDFSQHAWDESYTIPENQFLAYGMTGDRQHLSLARRFIYDDFFGPLSRGHNVLPGKHAYSHVNALSSSMQAYLSLGDPKYLQAAIQGFAMVDAQSYATGGWGPDEHFVTPGTGALHASLLSQRKSFETPCGSYAHLKLARSLLRVTRDPRYGDSMERVLYNTVLGAKPIQSDGHAFYYSDYTRQAEKTFHPDRWPCCSATLPIVAADHRLNACFTDAQGIYVNLYVPATINWPQGGDMCALAIATDYPHAPGIALTVDAPSPRTFAIRLRIPAWARDAGIRINGTRQPVPEPGRFASLQREWRSGDRIELELPLATRLQSIDAENPDTVALMAGPLVLMRMDPPALAVRSTRSQLLAANQTSNTREWRAGDLRFRPFVDIADEPYSAYQDVAGA